MNVLNKAPNTVVVVCATAVVLSVLGGSFSLAYVGKDPTTMTNTLTGVMTTLSVLTSTGAFLYSGAAARSAAKAEEQTNGSLKPAIKQAVHEVLNERETGGGQDGGQNV